VKKQMKLICSRLDERFLLPATSESLQIDVHPTRSDGSKCEIKDLSIGDIAKHVYSMQQSSSMEDVDQFLSKY